MLKTDDQHKTSQSPEKDMYISYSIKVIDALESKQKKHNEQNNSRVNLSKLKTVFKAAGRNYIPNEETEINTWCMARVNMYLEMLKGEKSYRKVERQIFANSDDLDLTESFIPTTECFEAARQDVEEYDLNFDFEDINNLYITIGKKQSRYGITEF